MKWLLLALRLLLGGIFIYAGVVKATASNQFALTLVPFTVIPSAWLPALAATLPWVEIAAGLLILPSPTKPVGAALICALSLMFCAIIGWALANGIIVSCSCFGRDEAPSAYKMGITLARDALLAIAAAIVFYDSVFRRRLRNPDKDQKTPANA